MYPCRIPDLSTGCPVIVSGRYSGSFPDSAKASGILSDLSKFVIDVKAQKAKDIPLERVFFQVLNLILQLIYLIIENIFSSPSDLNSLLLHPIYDIKVVLYLF